jgi:hypothetical protein
MRETYYEKRNSFEIFLKNKKNISLDKFITQIFQDQCFKETDILKSQFISQLLKDEIQVEYWLFLRNVMRNLGYLTDRRHTEEYAFDIAMGWLSEELIIDEIKKQAHQKLPKSRKFEVKLTGVDAEREFQSLRIRATADFYLNLDSRSKEELYNDFNKESGKNAIYRERETKLFVAWLNKNVYTKVDLFVDYKSTWHHNGYFDIKSGKMKHFQSDNLDYVLAFDVVHQNLYLISKNDALGYELTPNPAMGNVKTAKIPLTSPIDLNDIFEKLLIGRIL